MTNKFTVIVVSHVDVIAHQDATELVNVVDCKYWQQYYHDCTFSVGREIRFDAEMRKVLLFITY